MTISEFIAANSLTRAKFAKMIGVEEESVTRYMNGTRMPRRKQLDRILKVTNGAVTANDILQHEAAA
jgi:transcriptional regulator with XRE-family HTH domain